MQIQILDGTLRDGGYVNNWNFGERNIDFLVASLVASGIDIIELGFFKPQGKLASTLFDGILCGDNCIKKYLKLYPNQTFAMMLNVGELKDYEFIKKQNQANLFIRLAFRKNVLPEALSIAQDLVDCGVRVSLNPMFTNSYTESELKSLVNDINIIKPYAISIVDTAGAFTKKELLKVASFFDKSLDVSIGLGFHSHNNLNLSLENSLELLKIKSDRCLILDSCVAGMGRGAGNLDTYQIAQKIGGYKLSLIKEVEKKVVKQIYKSTPWGITNALYYSAKFGCHPDYGMSLEKSFLSVSKIKKILQMMPDSVKYKYDKSFLELNS